MSWQLGSWLRRRPAAAPLCTSTADSRARRPWDAAASCMTPSRAADRAVPAALHGASSGQRPQVRSGWAGGAGKGGAGTGGSTGSPSAHAYACLCKAAVATIAATQHGPSDSPPTRRCSPRSPCCPSQRRRRQRIRSRRCCHRRRRPRQQARPRPAGSSTVEPAACARLTGPARRQEPAARRSSQRGGHLEAAAAAAAAVRPWAAIPRENVRLPP